MQPKNKQQLRRRQADLDYPGGPAESWLRSKWRPMMAWVYMVTCITDFIIFPIVWSIGQAYLGVNLEQWRPITLEGAGLFHLAMGGIIGVTAWSRGKEKEATIFNGGIPNPISAQQIYYSGPSQGYYPNNLNNDNDGVIVNINRKPIEERIDQARKRKTRNEEAYNDLNLMPIID